ncbi:MAG TPA: hypothetical protein VHZ24_19155 [Pirellulales bacterium]|nr:hypothetical protein [Pirellulales bacterium]
MLGESLPRLAALTSLESLTLGGRDIRDAQLASLPSLKKLNSLCFIHCYALSDAALETVAAVPNLAKLELIGAPITDTGVAHLAAAKKLKSLTLRTCPKVTNFGIAHLQAALPKCKIEASASSESSPDDWLSAVCDSRVLRSRSLS